MPNEPIDINDRYLLPAKPPLDQVVCNWILVIAWAVWLVASLMGFQKYGTVIHPWQSACNGLAILCMGPVGFYMVFKRRF